MTGTRARFDGIIISHLGNINGRDEKRENTPAHVDKALKAGWHVCVDVIFKNGGFFLPHANGNSVLTPSFFSKPRVWSRAYDPETADALCNIGAHNFVYAGGFLALTSSQFVWTPPPHPLTARAIAYLPETAAAQWLADAEPAGLCSDTPAAYI
jgi:hypothetical protein